MCGGLWPSKTAVTSLCVLFRVICHDAFVVHASGIGQLQAIPPVAGPRLSLGSLPGER